MKKPKRQTRLTQGELQDRFMVTTSEGLGKEIRATADKENMSLSAWIRQAVEFYLNKNKKEE